MDSIVEQPALTDRRCHVCDLYVRIAERSGSGELVLYECALGHRLLVDTHGNTIAGRTTA